ncbi:RNA-dependent RNA polymerase [Striga asiatica]|uniref:RNA-dependent RNA polymerase n=1 Tax=Striga asiatica TaxID=4170 RepID=A0A5A7QU31_STRAF|nr:RNA-dependent RNA polymerase [Striga asiatica]
MFTAKYLKQCNQLLMWYVGSRPSSLQPVLDMPISLTRTGLPRIIPPQYRKMIRGGDMEVTRMSAALEIDFLKRTTSRNQVLLPKVILGFGWLSECLMDGVNNRKVP